MWGLGYLTHFGMPITLMLPPQTTLWWVGLSHERDVEE